MGKCFKCGRHGLFFKTNAHGLCAECQTNLTNEYASRDYVENESVRCLTIEDVAQFTMLPFHFNCELKKCYYGHPYAYVELDKINQKSAKIEIDKINSFIVESPSLSPLIPADIRIPVEDLCFDQKAQEHTKLLCHPYTVPKNIPEGKTIYDIRKKAKSPLTLEFTDPQGYEIDTTFGKLSYGQDGQVFKATINFWRSRVGYFYDFATVGRTFVLRKIKTSKVLDSKNLPAAIYEFSTT